MRMFLCIAAFSTFLPVVGWAQSGPSSQPAGPSSQPAGPSPQSAGPSSQPAGSSFRPAGSSSWPSASTAEGSSGGSVSEAHRELVDIINSRAGAIDTCTLRYLYEYQDADGQASVQMAVSADGSVAKAKATTALEGARNLRPCLEKAAKGYTFPPPSSEENVTLSFNVKVKKGIKFKMYAPGEQPKATAVRAESPSYFKFLPKNW